MIVSSRSYRDHVFTISSESGEPDFPDIPEIITSHPTMAGAFAHGCEALDLYLETLEKLGRPRPQSRHRLVPQTV
jgi:predicted RNase H-like HicB family nuclease